MRIRRKDVNESEIEVLVVEIENAISVSQRTEVAADVEEELVLFRDGDVADFDYSDEKNDSGEKKKRSMEKRVEKSDEKSEGVENISAPFDDGEIFDEMLEDEPLANVEPDGQENALELDECPDASPITDDVPDGAMPEISENPEKELERDLDKTEDTLNTAGDDDSDAEK